MCRLQMMHCNRFEGCKEGAGEREKNIVRRRRRKVTMVIGGEKHAEDDGDQRTVCLRTVCWWKGGD